MRTSKSNFFDKVLGRISRLDATGLQTVVQRLARERAFLEVLFNTIEDGVLVVDEGGRVLYLNGAVARLFNWQPNQVEGQPVTRLLPQLDWQRLLDLDLRGGERVVRQEFEIDYPTHRFIRLYAAPLDAQDVGSSGVALILHDATEARQQTFEAIESERVHSLTLLAASVAHEIGNPLNALHIHLQLMGRELKKLRQGIPGRSTLERLTKVVAPFEPAEADEIVRKMDGYLHVAKGEISRLDYIVTQFLEAIRPSTPDIKMGRINEVIRETVELLKPELDNRGLHVELNLAADLPPSPIDAAQLKQVLVNLIKNAMQAMSRGGDLTLQTSKASDGIVVTVADTGSGIPEEQLNRIFEPFFTTKKKGSGLGLMIVERIVRQLGGRTELISKVGKGTVFRIWLPLKEKSPRLIEAKSHA